MPNHNYTPYISGTYPIDGNLQFGFETELFDLPACFPFYKIEPALGISAELPVDAQAKALTAYCKSLPHGEKPDVMRKHSGPEFLPATLHRDDTGNVELVMGPSSDLFAFLRETDWVNKNIGVGSLQAMVSLPRAKFFGENPSLGAQAHLGWLNFFNELDILERLELGRERRLKEPGKGAVRSFLHPYLGPMIALRHRMLKKFLRENAHGGMFDAENIIRPARRDQSFKFMGSTAYRPDIAGPDRICFEIRDAHRDPELLRNRLARILFYWNKGTADFLKFCEVPAFDSAAAYELLPAPVRGWLEEICPYRAPAIVKDFEKARFTYEVYRNFSYPLRDWQPWLALLKPGASVTEAQNAYVARLTAVVGTRGEEGLTLAQSALVDFGVESGLFELFLARENELAAGL